jgi:hypothetical protein
MKYSKILIAATCLFLALPSAGQDSADYSHDMDSLVYSGSYFFRTSKNPDDYRGVYVEPRGTASKKLLRRFEGSVNSLRVAPQGPLVAVSDFLMEEKVSPDRANYGSCTRDAKGNLQDECSRIESRMIILDLEGKVVSRVDNVYQFSWSPEGDKIAYLTGNYSEKSWFRSTGAWILDLATQRTTRIYPYGQNIEWATWDGNIYIDISLAPPNPSGAVVVKHSQETGESSYSRHKGIRFSLDGRYYFRTGGDGDLGGEVFEASTDRQISLAPILELDKSRIPVAIGWLGNGSVVLRSPGRVEPNFLQDLTTGKRDRVDGSVIAISRAGGVIVARDGSFREQPLPSQ